MKKKTAATEHYIRLVVERIITSHAGIAFYVEYNAQGTPPYHGFSLLISVECACVEHYPECTVLGKMSEGRYLPNRVTAYGPVAETSVSVQYPRFLRSQVVFITTWIWRLLVWCNIVNTSINSFCFCERLLLSCKDVQLGNFHRYLTT